MFLFTNKLTILIMKIITITIGALMLLSACNFHKETIYTQEQLYERMSSGVVLIQNTYRYKYCCEQNKIDTDVKYGTMEWTDEYPFGSIEDLKYQMKSKETTNQKNVIYGTGFLISETGVIATNSHVISPPIDKIMIHNTFSDFFQKRINQYMSMLEDNNNDAATTKAIIKELNKWRDRANSNRYIKIESCIKIIYNNSSTDSLTTCYVIKNVPLYDLAIIKDTQLNGHTNTDVKWVDNLVSIGTLENDTTKWAIDFGNVTYSEEEKYRKQIIFTEVPKDKFVFDITKPNAKNVGYENKLFMIGFNQGPNLAVTTEGVKAQITQGYISQDTDDFKLMYSIPALHGSSGAPVVNQYGELVAINFAGLDNTQSFNYGIKIDKLKEIIDNRLVGLYKVGNYK